MVFVYTRMSPYLLSVSVLGEWTFDIVVGNTHTIKNSTKLRNFLGKVAKPRFSSRRRWRSNFTPRFGALYNRIRIFGYFYLFFSLSAISRTHVGTSTATGPTNVWRRQTTNEYGRTKLAKETNTNKNTCPNHVPPSPNPRTDYTTVYIKPRNAQSVYIFRDRCRLRILTTIRVRRVGLFSDCVL